MPCLKILIFLGLSGLTLETSTKIQFYKPQNITSIAGHLLAEYTVNSMMECVSLCSELPGSTCDVARFRDDLGACELMESMETGDLNWILSDSSWKIVMQKSPECPSGWLKARTSCYLLNHSKLAWPEAQASCHDQEAYLASIGDEQEKDLAISLQAAYSIPYLFLGGSWDGTAWHWDSGEPFVYTAWMSGEPGGQQFLKTTTGGWKDVKSFNLFPSLCEKQLIYD